MKSILILLLNSYEEIVYIFQYYFTSD